MYINIQKTDAHAISLNPFNVYSTYKRKYEVFLFFDEETNGSYLFANGLNRLAHLCCLHLLKVNVAVEIF
jgi:hypothetical protein